MLDTDTLEELKRDMDAQILRVKKIFYLMDECKERDLLEGISEEELQQLVDYGSDVVVAANTTKKVIKNLLRADDANNTAKKKTSVKKKKAVTPESLSAEELDFLS